MTGYQVNKKHWITAEGSTSLDEPLIQELVHESYRLIRDKLPKSQRP